MSEHSSIRQQLRNHAVALVSMAVAVSTLLYSAWRHEVTEDQRTVRQAGFEILHALGELQTISDHAHYTGDAQQGNPVSGWGRVLAIRDLTALMPPPATTCGTQLLAVWEAESPGLKDDTASNERISDAISACRAQTVEAIARLD
jgi:hypothetical protein